MSWAELRERNPSPDLKLPPGNITPAGYVVLQHGIRDNRPPKAYQRWINRFPSTYAESVLEGKRTGFTSAADDPNCLATIKHYRSLMPMAMQARKPVFDLKPADGAIGAHGEAVRGSHDDFSTLVDE